MFLCFLAIFAIRLIVTENPKNKESKYRVLYNYVITLGLLSFVLPYGFLAIYAFKIANNIFLISVIVYGICIACEFLRFIKVWRNTI